MRERDAELWSKWRRLISEQQASGQSVAAFCHARGMTSSQLFAWKKRLRESDKAEFVEVQMVPYKEQQLSRRAPLQHRSIEIRLERGCSLAVEPGFDADHLRALLAVLEAER